MQLRSFTVKPQEVPAFSEPSPSLGRLPSEFCGILRGRPEPCVDSYVHFVLTSTLGLPWLLRSWGDWDKLGWRDLPSGGWSVGACDHEVAKSWNELLSRALLSVPGSILQMGHCLISLKSLVSVWSTGSKRNPDLRLPSPQTLTFQQGMWVCLDLTCVGSELYFLVASSGTKQNLN